MKRIYIIVAGIITSLSLASCGPVGYISEEHQIDEMRNVMLIKPLSKIESVGKGDITVTDEAACIAAQEILLQTLKSYDTGLSINAVYEPSSVMEGEALKKDLESLYAQSLHITSYEQTAAFLLPVDIDNLLERTGHRYGLLAYQYGFSRTSGNYAAEVAKGVGLAILTLGTVYTVPYKDRSNIHVMIADSQTNRIVFHKIHLGPDVNPLKPKHVEKQVKQLFKKFRK